MVRVPRWKSEQAGRPRSKQDSETQTIAGFLKAMAGIAVRGVDGDRVAAVLEADSCVDDETLGAADAEIGMYKEEALGHGCGCGCGCVSVVELKQLRVD